MSEQDGRAPNDAASDGADNTRRVVVGLVVGVPISVVFLWLAVRNVDLAAVRTTLQEARPALVGLAVLVMAGVYWFQAVRWRNIAASPQVSVARFYGMVVAGVACNNVLPARLGDLLRARWLGLEARMPGGRALATVVLDRGCDLATLFLLLAVGVTTVTSAEWLARIGFATAIALVVLGGLLFFARVYTGRHGANARDRSLVRRVVRDTLEGLSVPIGRRELLLWLVLSLGAWAMWALSAIFVAYALGFQLGLGNALFVAAVMNLGVAVPSSPGFVGTYEWLGVASLGLLGIGSEEALAFSILLHACWYVPTTIAGGILLGVRALRRVSDRSECVDASLK